jgi:hypothetical protein
MCLNLMQERDYLNRAAECLQMAQQAKTSFQRDTLLDIASKWLLLAGDSPDTRIIVDLIEAMRRSSDSHDTTS